MPNVQKVSLDLRRKIWPKFKAFNMVFTHLEVVIIRWQKFLFFASQRSLRTLGLTFDTLNQFWIETRNTKHETWNTKCVWLLNRKFKLQNFVDFEFQELLLKTDLKYFGARDAEAILIKVFLNKIDIRLISWRWQLTFDCCSELIKLAWCWVLLS